MLTFIDAFQQMSNIVTPTPNRLVLSKANSSSFDDSTSRSPASQFTFSPINKCPSETSLNTLNDFAKRIKKSQQQQQQQQQTASLLSSSSRVIGVAPFSMTGKRDEADYNFQNTKLVLQNASSTSSNLQLPNKSNENATQDVDEHDVVDKADDLPAEMVEVDLNKSDNELDEEGTKDHQTKNDVTLDMSSGKKVRVDDTKVKDY